MGRLIFASLMACLVLSSAALGEKKDRWLADPVQGAWIRPSDVLYVGDSQGLGYFGDNLYRWLSDKRDPKTGANLTVWTYWTCGSDVMSWLAGGRTVCGIRACNGAGDCARDHGPNDGPAVVHYRPLREYLADIRPRLTIISLGTNFLTAHEFRYQAARDYYLSRAQTMIKQVRAANSRCIWIGPPQPALKTRTADEYNDFMDSLRQQVEADGCTFIDSGPLSDRRFVLPRDSEGTHYTGEGEKQWSVGVWRVLAPAVDKALAPAR
ncbi:MAG: hypothetical protein P4L57_12980 [Rhizomicrobium sp.]|nr:hypothetical protein [Rhizomicrobium sp.]